MASKKPATVRRYGFFSCPKCRRGWESAHVYCDKLTLEAVYKQECATCKIKVDPYKTEQLKCGGCGCIPCICSSDDDVSDEFEMDSDMDSDEERSRKHRHVDPKKPHRSDLCEKCQKGMPCDQ